LRSPALRPGQLAHDQLVYRFPNPQPDGRTELRLTPVELIDRLAALIPPRLHRHRYHGVLAPYHAGNGSFRAATWDWSLTGSGRFLPMALFESRHSGGICIPDRR
jgi:hypothetical protein